MGCGVWDVGWGGGGGEGGCGVKISYHTGSRTAPALKKPKYIIGRNFRAF